MYRPLAMPTKLASTAMSSDLCVPDSQDAGSPRRHLHERVEFSPAVIALLSRKGPQPLDVPFYALQTEPWGRGTP